MSVSSVSLSWTASGGSDAPTGYRILKGPSPSSLANVVGKNLGKTYTDSHVVTATTYYYEVEMVDSLGLTSGPSKMLTVATPGPPSVPANLAVTGNLPYALSLNHWDATSTGIECASVGILMFCEGTSTGSMSIHAKVTAPPYLGSRGSSFHHLLLPGLRSYRSRLGAWYPALISKSKRSSQPQRRLRSPRTNLRGDRPTYPAPCPLHWKKLSLGTGGGGGYYRSARYFGQDPCPSTPT